MVLTSPVLPRYRPTFPSFFLFHTETMFSLEASGGAPVPLRLFRNSEVAQHRHSSHTFESHRWYLHSHRSVCTGKVNALCVSELHTQALAFHWKMDTPLQKFRWLCLWEVLGKQEEISPIWPLEWTFLLFPAQLYSSQHQQKVKWNKFPGASCSVGCWPLECLEIPAGTRPESLGKGCNRSQFRLPPTQALFGLWEVWETA